MEQTPKKRGRPKDSKSTIAVKMGDLIELIPKHFNVEVGTAWLKKVGIEVKADEPMGIEIAPANTTPVIEEVEEIDKPGMIKLEAKEL